MIDGSVRERHGTEPLKISLKVKGLPLRSALKLILETRGLTIIHRHGVLLVVTQDEAGKTPALRIYDVRDLMMEIMVKEHCGKASWDENPRCTVELHNGLLTVTQSPEVHRQIRELLGKLRENK